MQLNHIYSGDCVKVMREAIPNESIQVIFADPPYNISGEDLEWKEKNFKKVNETWDIFTDEEYIRFTKDWLTESHRVLKPNGSIFVCCSFHNLAEVQLTVKQLGFQLLHLITWFKTNAAPNKNHRSLQHSSEFIIWATKGPKWIFNYDESKRINPARGKNGKLIQMRDVWLIPFCAGHERLKNEDGGSAHATQKPELLVERALKISTDKDSIVLDPFLGSGTTAAVAQRIGLPWVGIELDEKYVKLSQERLAKVIPLSCNN